MDEARGGPARIAAGRFDPVAESGPDPLAGSRPDAGADSRSPYRTTCPYFRVAGPDGALQAPLERPDPANRCAAIGPPLPQSLRQQAMACLSPEHTACPRFQHAESVPREAVERVPAQPARSRPRGPRAGSRATLAALLLLLVSAGGSFAFVLARGGLTLPGPAALRTNEVAAATATPTAVAAVVTAQPTPPQPTPSPTPAPTPAPSPSPTAEPTPSPTPTRQPRPTSERYAYLEPCPTKPACWIYTIRSGDALYALARYFGHPIETIYRLNPWTKVRGIHPGDKLILPPPTL